MKSLRLVLVCIVLFLAACSSNKELQRVSTGFYEVQKGDTLYSISFRYGVDFKELARWNRISSPYTIFPGQRIRLVPPSGSSPRVARTTKTAPKKTPASKPKPKPVVAAKPPGNWQWPVQGKLLQKFSSQNKGIDISAAEGSPVVAASAGKVVYAGNGLRGYGNLLIIKHNRTYFSAYAHNKRLLVTEGATVKRGQKVAEVGSSGTDTVKLHFEIRRDGNPEDPLKFLP